MRGAAFERRVSPCRKRTRGWFKWCSALFLALVITITTTRAATFAHPEVVQLPLDQGVDYILAPVWDIIRPVASLVELLSPIRLHLRLESLRDVDERMRYRAEESVRVACGILSELFAESTRPVICPEVLMVHSRNKHIASFSLGGGPRWLLVVTDKLVEDLAGAELRFLVGHEIGRHLLHHMPKMPGWAFGKLLSDATVLPRFMILRLGEGLGLSSFMSEKVTAARHTASQARWRAARTAEAGLSLIDTYRGLRGGRLMDLGAMNGLRQLAAPAVGYQQPGPLPLLEEQQAHSASDWGSPLKMLDKVAAASTWLRMPGAGRALGTAAVSSAMPKLIACACDLDHRQEAYLRTGVEAATCATSLTAAKLRAEVLSADRMGLLAASGDREAAIRALIGTTHDRDAAAMVALLSVRKLVEQAWFLSRLLPSSPFSSEPSLPTRVAELAAWAGSPQGRSFVDAASQVSVVAKAMKSSWR